MERITCQVYFTEKQPDGLYKPKTKKAYFYNFPLKIAKIGNIVDIRATSTTAKETAYSNPVIIAAVLDQEYKYIGNYSERPNNDSGQEIKWVSNFIVLNPAAEIVTCHSDGRITTVSATNNNSIYTTKKCESENKTMGKNMFGMNLEFGKVPSGKFKMSIYGLAFATGDGRYAVYNIEENEFTDVTEMTLDIGDMVYQMPCATKDVEIGDIIKHKGAYVIVAEATVQGDLIVIDPFKSEKITVVPTRNMFGFNFVTKVLNIAGNMFGNTKPDADNPFGNMMPFMMMSAMNDSNNSDNSMMKMMFMMNMMGGADSGMDFSKNPMAMMMFMNGMN